VFVSHLLQQAVRGPPGQENWRGETIDRRSIQISEEEAFPWEIPDKGVLEVVFSSFNKGVWHILCDSFGLCFSFFLIIFVLSSAYYGQCSE
jgi:hypothetical protein